MTAAMGVGTGLWVVAVDDIAIGRILAVAFVAADCDWIGCDCVRTEAGDAIGRILAVLGASVDGALQSKEEYNS